MTWRQNAATRLIGGWALQKNLSEPDQAGLEAGAITVMKQQNPQAMGA